MDLTNLISHWALDDLSDAHGENALTNNGGVAFADGKLDDGATFDGDDDSLSCASNAGLAVDDESFTFCAWVKSSNLSLPNAVAGKWSSPGAPEWNLTLSSTSARLAGPSASVDSDLDAFDTGVWYFLCAWYDHAGQTLNVQVNGGAVASAASGGSITATEADFVIGDVASGIDPMVGQIDSASFWKRVLTADERAELYNGGDGLAYPFAQPISGPAASIVARSVTTSVGWICPPGVRKLDMVLCGGGGGGGGTGSGTSNANGVAGTGGGGGGCSIRYDVPVTPGQIYNITVGAGGAGGADGADSVFVGDNNVTVRGTGGTSGDDGPAPGRGALLGIGATRFSGGDGHNTEEPVDITGGGGGSGAWGEGNGSNATLHLGGVCGAPGGPEGNGGNGAIGQGVGSPAAAGAVNRLLSLGGGGGGGGGGNLLHPTGGRGGDGYVYFDYTPPAPANVGFGPNGVIQGGVGLG